MTSVIDVIVMIALLGMMVAPGYMARQFHQTGVFLTTTTASASEETTTTASASEDLK